jgi:hypothetical protein
MTVPILPIIGIAASPAAIYGVKNAMSGNGPGVQESLGWLAGIKSGAFDWNTLQQNWTPILLGFAGHKIASMIGINRMLGKAKIPLVRL